MVALTPGDLAADGGAALVERVRAAVDAGLEGVLLREAALFDRDFLNLALELRAALGDGRWLGVHDRGHLVRECGADALHLGWSSLGPGEARGMLPSAVALGCSAHAGDDPRRWNAADYLFLSPVAATASHPDPAAPGWRPALGTEGFANELGRIERPAWALGGVGPDLAAPLRAAGASGLAVLGAVLGRSTPAAAAAGAAALLDAWRGAA